MRRCLRYTFPLMFLCVCGSATADWQEPFAQGVTRHWVGPEFWANRLQDWRLADGRVECVEGRASKPYRTVHLLTRRVSAATTQATLSVRIGLCAPAGSASGSVGGLLIGAGGSDLDYRAAALVHHATGPGTGVLIGVDAAGVLSIRDLTNAAQKPLATQASKAPFDVSQGGQLAVQINTDDTAADRRMLRATFSPADGSEATAVVVELPATVLAGNIALVSHPGARQTGRWWFDDLQLAGETLETHEDRTAGPILATKYTVAKKMLNLQAQLMPIGKYEAQTARLEVQLDDEWLAIAEVPILTPGWTATFHVPDWDAEQDVPYRVAYELTTATGVVTRYWGGSVRRDPTDKNPLVLAAFSCNDNTRGGIDRERFEFDADHLWFPHTAITAAARAQQPDVLFFAGDQIYEGASPTQADRSGKFPDSYLDYLYKWNLWCWAYRDLIKDRPTVVIPDDHDVFQGNLWGQGGRAARVDNEGGYIMPADWVEMVQRTQTGNLPAAYDPTPVDRGIGVYYTSLKVGGIDFAVLEDRKWKTGPAGVVPKTNSPRPDHIIETDIDVAAFDVPEAELLGSRQIEFLKTWAADWSGVQMKCVLSQTVFANVATHHGSDMQFLVADLDSNGWPQTPRNEALNAIRRGFAVMVAGDQHLASVVHHGIDSFNDAGWSFVVPSTANFYPRAWLPATPGANRRPGDPEYTGEFLDGLGNKMTVRAVANPGDSGHQPAALHDNKPGYGIVRFDKNARTITFECWPRYTDPADPNAKPYAGWPVTVTQHDQYARAAAAYLPELHVTGMTDPVVQVNQEPSGEVLYTLRIKGQKWQPPVFQAGGSYTVHVGEPGTDKQQVLTEMKPLRAGEQRTLEIKF